MRQSGWSGRVRAVEHVERLLVVAVVGERPAIGAEHRVVVRIVDRGLFEHGGGLGALADGAQRLGVADRGLGVARIGAIALAPDVHLAPPFGLGARRGVGARSSRWCRATGVVAAAGGGQRERDGAGGGKEARGTVGASGAWPLARTGGDSAARRASSNKMLTLTRG